MGAILFSVRIYHSKCALKNYSMKNFVKIYNILILDLSTVDKPLILEPVYVLVSICDHLLQPIYITCMF